MPLALVAWLVLALVGTTTSQNDSATFKVGLVCDKFLKYSEQDILIYNGTLWWAHWVNSRGGLVYNGTAKQVEIIQIDASTPNPALVISKVTEAYEELVSTYNVDLMVAPATSDRVKASISVSENASLINLVAGSQSDFLFRSNNSFIFTSAYPSADIPKVALRLLIDKGAKNYVIFVRPDALSVSVGLGAIQYLNASGLTMLNMVWVNSTATDAASLDSDLRDACQAYLVDEEIDIFVYSGIAFEFPSITSVFDSVRPKGVKSAVYLIGTSRYEQEFKSLGHTGDFWLSTARFDPSFTYGTSGVLGGTTAEFSADFTAFIGNPPSIFDAVIAGLLMTYYRAVEISGSIDSKIVRATMKNMSEFETFAFPVQYFQNGTNMYPQYIPLQYINGEGRPATLVNLVYPVTWSPSKDGLNSKQLVAIAIPISFIVVVVVTFAAIYIRKQRVHVVHALEQAEEGERRNYKIDYAALTLGKLIGAGAFGFVFRGEYRGADVAVKKLKSAIMAPAQLDQFAKESSVMIGLRHPNILLFMGVCVDPPELCIVTEFCNRGSLYEVIHNDHINLPFPLVKNMLEDILKGLLFIHAAGFIHRDFKSPNLLVDRNWTVKISDFGLSCLKSQSDSEAQMSLLWTAPEVLLNQRDCYSEKSDIYAFAIVVWELMARKIPFSGCTVAAIAPKVVKGERPLVDGMWDKSIVELLNKCWDPVPEHRFTVKEARSLVDGIYYDPDFEIGSSTTLFNYVEKAAPPSGTVTFVNTFLANASELWEHDPREMKKALTQACEVIRSYIMKHRGYEVKCNGEAFMIAFADTLQALNFCLRVQTALLKVEWSEGILAHPCTKEESSSKGQVLRKGLCFKMGIHIAANPIMEKSAETRMIDYSGPGVTRAALMAALVGPGRIMIDPAVYAKTMQLVKSVDPFAIQSLGPVVLKNIEKVDVYEIVPETLRERMGTKDLRIPAPPFGATTPGDAPDKSAKFEFPPSANKWVINFEDLHLAEKIGAGTLGEVRAAILRGEKVAVKELIKQKLNDVDVIDLRAESALLYSLLHENILRFKGMCMKEPHICTVTEFMDKGGLSKVLYGPGVTPVPWDIRKQMIRDIVSGMVYLHSKGILHRDVKSCNMMVGYNWRVKVADFGFTQLKAENQTMTQCGNVAWTAPEIFEGAPYTEQADIYSFGIILWEIVYTSKPWDGFHSMRITQYVTGGKRPSISSTPPNTPALIMSLMELCWAQEPHLRPSFATILRELESL